MACMKLGSKSDVFYLDRQNWLCSTGLPSDVIVEIGETSFHLHKFPLISRSELLETIMKEDNEKSVIELHELPGGAKAFLLIAKFCYGVKMELTPSNVVSLRCAAEYLQMTEDYGEGNLIIQTENFLNHIFTYWTDTLRALRTCEEDVLPFAEELHITSRCIQSLVLKAADPSLVTSQSVVQSPENRIGGLVSKITCEDWWYEDVSSLSLPLYKRFMHGASGRHMKAEKISGSLVYYAKKSVPLLGSQFSGNNSNKSSSISCCTPSEADQRNMIEEIVEMLPNVKGITPTKFLLRVLRTAMALYASSSCCASLEKKIGAQLDEADLDDLLIPNIGYSMETLYDIDCVQRMLDHFMIVEHDAHPWLTDSEKEQMCKLMNCQKLSLEASTHAAQNERLPLRVVVQVLFFEQLKLRTSVAGWFFSSDNNNNSSLENSEKQQHNLALIGNDQTNPFMAFENVRERVSELEKEYLHMKKELEKMMVKSKISWNVILKKLGCRLIPKPPNNNKVTKSCRKTKITPTSTTITTTTTTMEDQKAMTEVN
ncbi:hypothetical protein Ahy_A09g041477 [Arachis hypogaea]|uniref:BTB/POZ domain-containing protein n=1 Tax=Arachis hypogaea TaxID=3818 RepID=A0A445BCW0_ARAHY|nr:hypothetical protein Ahy_A09g041477 [Arachis hypogaea]